MIEPQLSDVWSLSNLPDSNSRSILPSTSSSLPTFKKAANQRRRIPNLDWKKSGSGIHARVG